MNSDALSYTLPSNIVQALDGDKQIYAMKVATVDLNNPNSFRRAMRRTWRNVNLPNGIKNSH